MYQANLSYKVLQRYLTEIVEASLVIFENHDQRYKLTEKGHEYLDAYKDYSRCSKNMEKHLYDFSIKKKALEKLCPPNISHPNQQTEQWKSIFALFVNVF